MTSWEEVIAYEAVRAYDADIELPPDDISAIGPFISILPYKTSPSLIIPIGWITAGKEGLDCV